MITKRDLHYLKVAESVSMLSDYPRIKIGAVIVHKKQIVGMGFNTIKTHTEQKKYNRLLEYDMNKHRLHAEINALNHINREIKGSTMYIFRLGGDGHYQNCKPCSACMGKIKDSGIKRIVHTIFNGILEIKL